MTYIKDASYVATWGVLKRGSTVHVLALKEVYTRAGRYTSISTICFVIYYILLWLRSGQEAIMQVNTEHQPSYLYERC